jgi:hypothetical protein
MEEWPSLLSPLIQELDVQIPGFHEYFIHLLELEMDMEYRDVVAKQSFEPEGVRRSIEEVSGRESNIRVTQHRRNVFGGGTICPQKRIVAPKVSQIEFHP